MTDQSAIDVLILLVLILVGAGIPAIILYLDLHKIQRGLNNIHTKLENLIARLKQND